MGELKHADDCQSHIVDVRGRPDECTCGADTRPRTEGRGEGKNAVGAAEAGVSAVQQPASSSAQHSAEWRCRRCGRDEVDCRENGCPRGTCPMEFVG